MNIMKSLKGSLLIASPNLTDPNFHRTVVFVAEHNEEGAFGLVINRPTETRVAQLWRSLSNEECTSTAHAFVGGPVQKNALLLLHGHSDLSPEAEPVIPGVFLGSEVEMLGELLKREAKSHPTTEVKFRVFCGYAGWGAGQLDDEMKAGGWLTCPATSEHVFHAVPEKLWNIVMESLGGVCRFFALMPRNPEEN